MGTVVQIILLNYGRNIKLLLSFLYNTAMLSICFGIKSKKEYIRTFLYILLSLLLIHEILLFLVKSRTPGLGDYILASIILILFFLVIFRLNFYLFTGNIFWVTLRIGNKIIKCRGFWDSGNMMYDNFNGNPVIIISPDLMKKMYGNEISDTLKKYASTGYFEYDKCTVSMYPLICKTINGQNMLPAMRINTLEIYNKKDKKIFNNITAAVANYDFDTKDYDILLHQTLLQ